jgi:regulator of sirC expression with transglutaminase-like and TPR domain
MDARQHFAALISRPDEEIPLAEAALWIAADSRPEIDVERSLRELDALCERAICAVGAADDDEERVALLNHMLFVEEGFGGNETEYEDPRNSFIDQVLERRTGIPITLSVIYVEVARRLGLEAFGIGFPGHFLAKVVTARGEIIIDAFAGQALSFEECEELLRRVAGDDARLGPELLVSAENSAILRRILSNLKILYVSRQEYQSALGCIERILMLTPDDPIELRDRGLVLRELECFGPALADLERFVATMPAHETAAAIRSLVDELQVQARRIH